MKVAVFGSTGFVGSYLVDALVEAGHRPILLVRPESTGRVLRPDDCDIVAGSIDDDAAIAATLRSADAAIYNIGILRESPSRGVTFDALQRAGAERVIDACGTAGARRFLLMSANGIDAERTPYQQTKRAAERHLADAGLDYTVVRPSVVFGDPRGRMEFASQLARDIIQSPLPAPLFYPGLLPTGAGRFALSPVHVADVAAAFVKALERDDMIGRTLRLGGPETLSWRDILQRIADATGRRKLMLPVPALGVATAAALFDRFEGFPITRDQLTMLLAGNTCPPDDLEQLGLTPRAFDRDQLDYLNAEATGGCRWQNNAA